MTTDPLTASFEEAHAEWLLTFKHISQRDEGEPRASLPDEQEEDDE